MRWQKIACLSLVLITVPVIIESCCLTSCCGERFTQQSYDIDELVLTATTYPAVPPYPVVVPSTTLKNTALLIDVRTTYASMIVKPPPGFAAFACDPAPDESNQTITSLVITSNAHLSTTTHTIMAGSSLNEFFAVYDYKYASPIEQIIGSRYLTTFSLRSEDELNQPQTHTFTVTITLDDGRMFELVSDPLDLAQG
jgi:hypothetical protein